MCTRYYVELSPELRPVIEAARRSSLAGKMVHQLGRPVVSEGEVRPTDIAPVIASNSRGVQSVFPMIFGFQQAERDNTKRSQPLLNARMETADTKPLFRECWQRRRCIVPASYYFEWEHLTRPDGTRKTGSKYAVQPNGAAVTWLAGLYRMENGYPFFVILTRPSAGELAGIHDRMPLILPEKAIADWISPASSADTIKAAVDTALTDLVIEKV